MEMIDQADSKHLSIKSAAEAFARRLGAKGFTTDPDEIAPWLTDWRGLYHGKAVALLSPSCVEEVADAVKIAAAHGVALVPQGGNTSMVGGATPDASGEAFILSLRRMNAIRSINTQAMEAHVEAGVILSQLHDAADNEGMRFPLTLGAKGSATIGGLIATNAGGTQVLRFGTMRSLTLGIEAVLPDGRILNTLKPLKKDNRGYDFTQLLIGSEGTLGIITSATVRLYPAVKTRSVAWVGLQSPAQALVLLRNLESASGDAVESFEVVSGHALSLVLEHIPNTRNPLAGEHPWHVLIEFVGDDAEARLSSLLMAQIEQEVIEDAVVAASNAQADAFWRIRESVSEAERASGPAIQHDISVPVDDMPAFMINAARDVEAKFPGVSAGGFGHLGDGNVHFHVRAPAGVDAAAWRAGQGKAASQYVYDLVTAAGGSLSAEHGIGQMKLDELVRQSDPLRINMIQSVKNALDPKGIMNPGKLVPPCAMS
jgi:FAD/FMN-containing dehydrogenase